MSGPLRSNLVQESVTGEVGITMCNCPASLSWKVFCLFRLDTLKWPHKNTSERKVTIVLHFRAPKVYTTGRKGCMHLFPIKYVSKIFNKTNKEHKDTLPVFRVSLIISSLALTSWKDKRTSCLDSTHYN